MNDESGCLRQQTTAPKAARTAPRPPAEQPRRRARRPAAKAKRLGGARILGVGVLLLLCGALAIGFWQHYKLHAQVMSTAEQLRDFVPSVRAAPVRASASTMSVNWPGTTEAFEQANIFARASGYISKREVDIGSHVKAGQLLVEITAPELDHQIAQAEATLAQMQRLPATGKGQSRSRPGHLGSRQTSGAKRLGHSATRRYRSAEPSGARCRG